MSSIYSQNSNISRTLVGNKIDHSDVDGASPASTAPTTSSFSTQHLASMEWAKKTAAWDKNHLRFGIRCTLYQRFYSIFFLQSFVVLFFVGHPHDES